jgi:hypothetical protein
MPDRVMVLIPTCNEVESLPGVIARLRAAIPRLGRREGPVPVPVATTALTDATAELDRA